MKHARDNILHAVTFAQNNNLFVFSKLFRKGKFINDLYVLFHVSTLPSPTPLYHQFKRNLLKRNFSFNES
jgi:hypothetical protein